MAARGKLGQVSHHRFCQGLFTGRIALCRRGSDGFE